MLGTKMLRQWMAFFASLIVMDVHSPRNGVVGRLTVLSKPSDPVIIGTQVSQLQKLKALRLIRASLKTSWWMEESAPENAQVRVSGNPSPTLSRSAGEWNKGIIIFVKIQWPSWL